VFVVVVDVRLVFFDDERPGESPIELQAGVAVIEVRARWVGSEPILERATRFDGVLRQVRHAVHRVRDRQPVPVDRRLVGQFVSSGRF
jgi:hypothetical protein